MGQVKWVAKIRKTKVRNADGHVGENVVVGLLKVSKTLKQFTNLLFILFSGFHSLAKNTYSISVHSCVVQQRANTILLPLAAAYFT